MIAYLILMAWNLLYVTLAIMNSYCIPLFFYIIVAIDTVPFRKNGITDYIMCCVQEVPVPGAEEQDADAEEKVRLSFKIGNLGNRGA